MVFIVFLCSDNGLMGLKWVVNRLDNRKRVFVGYVGGLDIDIVVEVCLGGEDEIDCGVGWCDE